jgi:hypothetical protein
MERGGGLRCGIVPAMASNMKKNKKPFQNLVFPIREQDMTLLISSLQN